MTRFGEPYPITFEEARKIGLHVKADVACEFVELLGLYPQPVRYHPSVEYLHEPRWVERSPADSKPRYW